MAHFGGFWGPNSPKYDPILLKFAPELVFKESKWKQDVPKVCSFFQFLSNFDPIFLYEVGRNRKKLDLLQTKLRHLAIRISQNQGPILSQFFRENTITFCPILAVFCLKRGRGRRLKCRNQNLTQPLLPTRLQNMQRVWSHHMPVLSLSLPKVVFFNFQTFFQVCLLFQVPSPLFRKKCV